MKIKIIYLELEPVCSYRFAVRNSKKKFLTSTGLWNRGPLKILNGIELILDDQGNHLDSYTISLKSFRSFRGPLFRKPVTGQELFFAVSYSKPALVFTFLYGNPGSKIAIDVKG